MATWTDLPNRTFKAVLSSTFINQLLDNVRWLKESTADLVGPVDVPTLSGFGGAQPTVRRIGRVVELRSNGNVTGTIPVGLTEVCAPGAVPVNMRPQENVWGAAFLSTNNTGSAVVRADGSVAIVHQTGGARSSAQFSFTWTVA